VDAVVIATSAQHAADTMREAADLGIRYAWMHRSFGAGSVSPEATRIGRDAGILVIDGGCPPDVRQGLRRRPPDDVPDDEAHGQGPARGLTGSRRLSATDWGDMPVSDRADDGLDGAVNI
jgi:hypothetical protein